MKRETDSGNNLVDLSVELGPIKIKNPVITASGTFGYGMEFSSFVDLNMLGGIVVKGISIRPMDGNPPPRIVETPCGMLNAIGLANIGVESFLKDKLPVLREYNTCLIVNIYGHSIREYEEVAYRLKGVDGIDALEVNISCPNVEEGGMAFGVNPDTAHRVTDSVVRSVDKPVIVKLSPNVSDIGVIAKAVEDAGADAISLINTLTGMSIDIETRRPRLSNIWGGLSGPAIRPVALYMVYKVSKAVEIPIIGIGGIMNARDALEFMIAGANAVQVGTANFVDPSASIKIIEGLKDFCIRNGIKKISALTGTLKE
jgi:dihydroorotate dehydrogenase (NAD+) catalytic subunit